MKKFAKITKKHFIEVLTTSSVIFMGGGFTSCSLGDEAFEGTIIDVCEKADVDALEQCRCTAQSNPCYEFTIGLVKFAFTSRAKANMQMNVIRDKIKSGEWWWDANGKNAPKGKIISDVAFRMMNDESCRDLCVEAPNGWRTVYRMTPIQANCGCRIE